MTNRLTVIIILISAATIWTTVLLALGFLPFLLSPLGLITTAIWLLALLWAGLISFRTLAWTFILMGVFFLFFPLTLNLPDIIGASIVPFFLIFVGINFTFGVLSAITSFHQGKKSLTTKEKEKYN